MLLTILLAASPAPSVSPAPAPPPVEPTAPAPEQRRRRPQRREDVGEVVRLVTADRVSIAATWFAPRARHGSKMPGVVLVHDAGSDRSGLNGMALYLQKKAFGVLTLDLRGHGQSATEEFDWKKMDPEARRSAWAFASRDLEAAAVFLRHREEIHSANLSLVGLGLGGALTLRHAVDDEATRAVVLVAPPAGEGLGYDLVQGVKDLAGLPCLIVVPREGRERAEWIQSEGQAHNDGYEYVTVQVMRSSADELLEDKRLNPSFSKWLDDQVNPTRKK